MGNEFYDFFWRIRDGVRGCPKAGYFQDAKAWILYGSGGLSGPGLC